MVSANPFEDVPKSDLVDGFGACPHSREIRNLPGEGRRSLVKIGHYPVEHDIPRGEGNERQCKLAGNDGGGSEESAGMGT